MEHNELLDERHYRPLDEKDWYKEIQKFKLLVANFMESNGYEKHDVLIFETEVFQIITKVHQRKEYFKYFHHLNISDFKELALYCFWIIKIKPLHFDDTNATEKDKISFKSINEKFALFYIIKTFRSLAANDSKKQKRINALFTEQYMYELVYSFTYRDISKEALILLVETMALALDFQAYRE